MSVKIDTVDLYVTFSSGDVSICNDVSEIILDKMSFIEEFSYNSQEHQSTVGDHKFYTGIMSLSVSQDKLLDSLNQLDHIKSGFASPMIPDKCNDITVVVNFLDGSDVNNSINHYFLNQIQEQTKRILELESQVNNLQGLAGRYEAKFEYYDAKYASMQTYVHSYIDLNRMAEVVRDIAETVDPDILLQYSKATIH